MHLSNHDHRSLGQRLDLFHFQEEAPGMVFWHPRGYAVYRALEELIRRQFARDGFEEVRSPQILGKAIWEKSGHWQKFSANMFRLEDVAVKPVSCPGHLEIAKRRALSYRDLPLRIGELG